MKMIDTGKMTVDEIDEAIAYMLPYLDGYEIRQIKAEIDENSMIFTTEQYNKLCATLYSSPTKPEEEDNNVYSVFDIEPDSVDMDNYVSYVSTDTDYLSYQPLW